MMKPILVFILMACCSLALQAQIVVTSTGDRDLPEETLDSAYLKVTYTLNFVKDAAKPEETDSDEMLLLVGKNVSKFFSYLRFRSDSIVRTMTLEQMLTYLKDGSGQRSKITYDMFKNYPAGKISTIENLAMTYYRVEEPYELPEWEIQPDTMNILGYPCQKAIASFRGRDYVAWFTMDIPVSNGPWKFAGLPGLILNIADTQNHYVFECSGIETPQDKPAIGMKKRNYAKVSKKDYNKVYDRYRKDPIGFMSTAAPNVKITMTNPDGTPAKNQTMPAIPHNPMERSE